MHRFFLSILFAIGVLSSFSLDGRGAESERVVAASSASRDLPLVLASLRSVTGEMFQATVTRHFVIVHEAGAAGIADMGRALESAYDRFYHVFARRGFVLDRSEEPLVWVCFPRQNGFNRYALRVEGMDLSWLDGYYSTVTNRVAVVQPDLRMVLREPDNPLVTGSARPKASFNGQQSEKVLPMTPAGSRLDITRLTHELAHQLAFNTGLQRRAVTYPMWVSEGLATNFEGDGLATLRTVSANTAHADSVGAAYRAGELLPLRQFVVQTQIPSDARVGRRHYGQAWALFRFLLLERPENLREYLRRAADLPTGHRNADVLLSDFVQAFGAPEKLEPEWTAFVMDLANARLGHRPSR